jgi:hypothetical protein
VCSRRKERTACLVDRTADAFAFFVAVQDRQLTAHDRPLVLDQLDAVLREVQPLIEAHAWVVADLRCVLPEPVPPPLFVVAAFEDDRHAWKLLPQPRQQLRRRGDLAAKVSLFRVFDPPAYRVEVARVAVQDQRVDANGFEMAYRRLQRYLAE